MGDLSQNTKTMKKANGNSKLKNTKSEIKEPLDRLSGRLDTTKESAMTLKIAQKKFSK